MTEENLMNEEELMGELPEVELIDGEGNTLRYREEMVIPYDEKYFAILVSIQEEGCASGCGCHDEAHAIIMRIEEVEDEDGQYLPPTDEEFDAVSKIYDDFIAEEE